MDNNEIEIEIGNDMPKVEYIFYQVNEKNTINKNTSKKLYITQEMIKYHLIMETNEEDQIIITITEQNENSIIKYQAYLNIQNFINLSPYFKLLYKINSIYCIDNFFSFIKGKLDSSIYSVNRNIINNNSTINIINLKNSKIKISHLEGDKDKKEIELNKILFIFDIVYINLQKEKIIFELEKTEIITDKNLINIYKILLRNKFNYINRIQYLESKLSKTQNSFNKYELLMNKYNSYFDQDLQLKLSFLNIDIDTNIFDSPEQYNFIINTLSNLYNINGNNISLTQIYKASCNGDNIKAFHKYCDNIKNTLIIILTDDKRKFGGYTEVEWDISNKYKFDDKAFLFSLDTYEVFFILDKFKNKAINCRDNFYSPIFGEDLFIFDGFFSSKLNRTEEKYFDYSKSKNPNEEYKLAGQRNFTVSEMEVYKINFSV